MRFLVPALTRRFRLALLTAFALCTAIPSVRRNNLLENKLVPRRGGFSLPTIMRARKNSWLTTRGRWSSTRCDAKWLPDERFWYRDLGPDGSEFVLYDAAHGTRQPAFDHAKLAAALSAAAGATYDAAHLPFMSFEFSADGKSISFQVKAQHWNCDLQAYRCADRCQSGQDRGCSAARRAFS